MFITNIHVFMHYINVSVNNDHFKLIAAGDISKFEIRMQRYSCPDEAVRCRD